MDVPVLTCFSHPPARDGALRPAAEGLPRQAGRLHEAAFFGAVRPVGGFELQQGCGGGNRSNVYSHICIFYYNVYQMGASGK